MAEFSSWGGFYGKRIDMVSLRLEEQFRATFSPYISTDHECPPGIFWCLAPDVVNHANLGEDGVRKLAQELPELSYFHRVWIGGNVRFLEPLMLRDEVTKESQILDISEKTGASGKLFFIKISNTYKIGNKISITEEKTLCYRERTLDLSRSNPLKGTNPAPDQFWQLTITPVLLFRYSALTFNAHRIHYDKTYTTQSEGYSNLVAQAPLQATLMLNLAADLLGKLPIQFEYASRAPLFCGETINVEGTVTSSGIETKITTGDRLIMTGKAVA